MNVMHFDYAKTDPLFGIMVYVKSKKIRKISIFQKWGSRILDPPDPDQKSGTTATLSLTLLSTKLFTGDRATGTTTSHNLATCSSIDAH